MTTVICGTDSEGLLCSEWGRGGQRRAAVRDVPGVAGRGEAVDGAGERAGVTMGQEAGLPKSVRGLASQSTTGPDVAYIVGNTSTPDGRRTYPQNGGRAAQKVLVGWREHAEGSVHSGVGVEERQLVAVQKVLNDE